MWEGSRVRSPIALFITIPLASGGLAATATSASAAPPVTPGSALIAAAGKALKDHPAAVKRSAKDTYAVYSSKKGTDGRGVVRYTRSYDGLRVYGGDLIIRTKA